MFASGSGNDPNASSKCPYCKKEIGVESNTYRFQLVEFSAGGARNGGQMRGSVISISCSRCNKVVGFVNQ